MKLCIREECFIPCRSRATPLFLLPTPAVLPPPPSSSRQAAPSGTARLAMLRWPIAPVAALLLLRCCSPPQSEFFVEV
jgi:hypothetical protein